MVEEAILERDKQRGIAKGTKAQKRPIAYALAVEHLHGHHNNGAASREDPSVILTDVTRRYASSMVETIRARGIVLKKESSKPSLRKTRRAMLWGIPIDTQEERPDEWFSKFLDAVSKRTRPNRGRKTPPPLSSRAKLKALQKKGRSPKDAIALESDESDSNPKPQASAHHDEECSASNIDHEEESQLQESAKQEPLPTSKAAFKKHPLYVIRSVLNSTEVLKPTAKNNVCGMFKGELVFRRTDVETALPAKRWLYEGRKVREAELESPILKVKARKPPTPKGGFKALDTYGFGAANDGSEESRLQQIREASAPLGDGKESLYGSWQTDPWEPSPVFPGDPIPVNEHRNVELELLNPGLVHVHLHHVAKVAKKLGLPYAPCLVGFEGSGKPQVRGIVVHETNEELLREAHAAMADHLLREENEKKEKAILLRWKRLLVGVLTKDRLEREYGDDDEESD